MWTPTPRPRRHDGVAPVVPSLTLAFVGLLGLALAASSCCKSKTQSDTSTAGAVGGSAAIIAAQAKLDPELQQRTVQLATAGRADSVLAVLVQVKSGGGDQARHDLESAGLKVDSIAGDVVTGRATAGALNTVAMLPSVVRIQPARTYQTNSTERP
jgi:hypothetical protein